MGEASSMLVCVGVLFPSLYLFFAHCSPSAFFNLLTYLTCFVPAWRDIVQIIHTTKRCHCSTVKGQTGPILNIHLDIYTLTKKKKRKKRVPFVDMVITHHKWFDLKLMVKGSHVFEIYIKLLIKAPQEKQIKEYFRVLFSI